MSTFPDRSVDVLVVETAVTLSGATFVVGTVCEEEALRVAQPADNTEMPSADVRMMIKDFNVSAITEDVERCASATS